MKSHIIFGGRARGLPRSAFIQGHRPYNLDRGLNHAAITTETNSETLLDRGLNHTAMTGEACLAPTSVIFFLASFPFKPYNLETQ